MPVINIAVLSGKSANTSHLLITGMYLETESSFIESMIQSRERPFFPLEDVKLFSESYRRWRTHLIAGETAQWLLIILTVIFSPHLYLTLYLTVLPCMFFISLWTQKSKLFNFTLNIFPWLLPATAVLLRGLLCLHHCIFCCDWLLHAFVDHQDSVSLAIPTSAASCRHCYSGDTIKIWGSSSKQLLYFDADLQLFAVGSTTEVCTMGFTLGGQASVQGLSWCGMRSELSTAFHLGTSWWCTVPASCLSGFAAYTWHRATREIQELKGLNCEFWTVPLSFVFPVLLIIITW